MKTTTLQIENIKCGGCAHSISTKLSSIVGLDKVAVDYDNGTVQLHYSSEEIVDKAKETLEAMGYPEANAENGVLMKAKSYANCLIGKSSVLFADAKHSDS